jgi:hypothetical protein
MPSFEPENATIDGPFRGDQIRVGREVFFFFTQAAALDTSRLPRPPENDPNLVRQDFLGCPVPFQSSSIDHFLQLGYEKEVRENRKLLDEMAELLQGHVPFLKPPAIPVIDDNSMIHEFGFYFLEELPVFFQSGL